jgi:hypothetical protein
LVALKATAALSQLALSGTIILVIEVGGGLLFDDIDVSVAINSHSVIVFPPLLKFIL